MMHESALPKYFRHSTTDVEPVLEAVRAGMVMINEHGQRIKPPKIEVNGRMINVKSLRMQTFAVRGCVCVSCGLQATFFALERNMADEKNDAPHHLNLYGVKDDVEIIFTHDHILARALGGEDKLNNTQTMCYPCNQLKSIDERILVEKLTKDKP